MQRLDPDQLARLLIRYGMASTSMLPLLNEHPELAQPVCRHHEDLQVELVHALQQEFACTLTDVMARRTRIAWSECHGLESLATITALFQRYGNIPPETMTRQVADYHQFLALHQAFRP